MKKISTLVGIIIIIVAVAIFFGGVFAWQYFAIKSQPKVVQPTGQTADWKTYTSTQYGFSFQYPQNLLLIEKDSKVQFNLISSATLKNIQSVDITVGVMHGPCSELGAGYPNPFRHLVEKDFINSNGIAFQFFGTGDSGMGFYSLEEAYATDKNGSCYDGDLGMNYSRDESNLQWPKQTGAAITNYESILEEIMSTFKFTK